MKHCPRCDRDKPSTSFHKNKNTKSGLNWCCRACASAYGKALRANNPARDSAYQRRGNLKSKYKLTPEQYDAMSEAQMGVCFICGHKEVNGKNLSVDHDHACCPGKISCGECIRALLCQRCNITLGLVGDNPLLLMAMADYLEVMRG